MNDAPTRADEGNFSRADVRLAAGALQTQLSAGVNLRVAVARMKDLQKKHARTWGRVAAHVEAGGTLSEALEGLWPETALAALRAGERTASVPEVCARIDEALGVMDNVKSIMFTLLYPVGIILGGIGLFGFFMLVVIPVLTRADPKAAQVSPVIALSQWMNQQYAANGIWIGIGILAFVAGTIAFLLVPANRDRVLSFIDGIPVIGDAVRSLWFGSWSYQMALLDSAGGIPIQESLRLSASMMPTPYRVGLLTMSDEVVKSGLYDAATPDPDNPSDPRGRWPFYVVMAFQMAHDTGMLGEKLTKFAPALIQEGTRAINFAAKLMQYVSMLIAGILVAVPMVGYFTAVAAALKKAFS